MDFSKNIVGDFYVNNLKGISTWDLVGQRLKSLVIAFLVLSNIQYVSFE